MSWMVSLTDYLYADNHWVIAILMTIIAIMLPHYLASPVIHTNEPSDSESTAVVEYVVFFLLLLGFAWAVLRVAGVFVSEYKLREDAKVRTGSEFSSAAYFWYRIDYLFSNTKTFKIYALLTATILLIAFGGGLWVLVSNEPLSESVWTAWTYIADPGTHADNAGWLRRLVSFILTVGGMVIFAMVIGIISEEISSFVENLRKGKSRVVESGHTLIIGQGDKLMPTIQQIALANESEGGGLIVVLTTSPKEELEDLILGSSLDLRGTQVIVRSGSPHLHADLKRVCAWSSRSIIVLADRSLSDPDMTDVSTVRTVMSLRGLNAPQHGHIVCEVCDIDNEELITLVGREHVETVVSHDIVGRLMIQCAREQGLAAVLHELLGFEGSEFYISSWDDKLVGKTFGEVSLMFRDAIVIGIFRDMANVTAEEGGSTGHTRWNHAAPPSYHRLFPNFAAAEHQFRDTSSLRYTDIALRLELNPKDSEIFHENDMVIVIAEDNDTYAPGEPMRIDLDRVNRCSSIGLRSEQRPEKMLFVGWRRDMDDMVLQVDDYVCKGSELTLYSHVPMEDRESRLTAGGLDTNVLQNVQLIHLQGSTTSRKDLECLPLETYDSILILADEELESSRHTYDMLHADSKSLTCLILIKDIQESIRMEVKKFETKLLKEVEREDALWKTTGPVRHGAPPFVTAVPVSAEEVRATVTLGASDEEHSVPGSPLRTVGKSLSTPAAAAETIALTPACGFKHTLEERRSFVSKLFHLPSSGNGGEDSSSDPVDASMPTHWTAQSKGRSQSLSPSLLQRLHETYYEYAKHAYTVECIASEQHERSSITAEDSSEAVQAAAYAVEATYVSDSPVQRSRKPRRFSQTESSMTPSQQDAGIATPQKLFLHTDSSRRRPSFSDSMMSPSHSSPHSDNAHRPMSRRTLPCRHKSAACLENPFANLKRSNRGKHSALLSEILDSRTKNVISLALASDFVLSNELISMAIAMVSEQREVNCILKELFSGKGNELHINPVDEYVLIDSQLSFAEMMFIARRKRHVAIGYTMAGKVYLNPANKEDLIVWDASACLVVIYARKQEK